jgi:hypothetical protein
VKWAPKIASCGLLEGDAVSLVDGVDGEEGEMQDRCGADGADRASGVAGGSDCGQAGAVLHQLAAELDDLSRHVAKYDGPGHVAPRP